MCWLKRDVWKASVAIAGMALLLLLMMWVPLLAASAHEETWGVATPGTVTVQATPTQDATVTALNKEKLAQEASQLQRANDRGFFAWLWTYGSTLFSTFVVVGSGIFAFVKWRGDRRKERENEQKERENERQKQEKERFESFSSVIIGLQDEKEGTRVAAANMLRMVFLRPGYERFHQQIFNLAVTNIRLHHVDLNTPERLDPLSQALITVYKESFPLARKALIGQEKPQYKKLEALDASGIRLDHAFLRHADLEGIWMRDAFLTSATQTSAGLDSAMQTSVVPSSKGQIFAGHTSKGQIFAMQIFAMQTSTGLNCKELNITRKRYKRRTSRGNLSPESQRNGLKNLTLVMRNGS